MEPDSFQPKRIVFTLCVCLLCALPALGQQLIENPQIPRNFDFDMKTAARLRPQLIALSAAASEGYGAGERVFERLIEQVPRRSDMKVVWELRIVDDDQLNAYSSADGTIYVETGLAHLAGESAGLWASILSHEIAHVVRRDWARRYLYQKSLESGGAMIVIGDPALPSAAWTDSQEASANLGRFCRQMEVEADREALMLMVSAGYHPDFIPALHHLLHAQGTKGQISLYAMHPCWEERDRELREAYTAASIEFEHRWPEWYATAGGNPPLLVFTDEPIVKKTSSTEWEIQVPMRCQNLVGAVEVMLRVGSGGSKLKAASVQDRADTDLVVRQLTGCTSPHTTVKFRLLRSPDRSTRMPEVYVLDPEGTILARADLPN